MVVFLTPLAHPNSVKNIRQIERLLDITCHSLLSQTDQDFRLVVICNEIPSINFTQNSKVIFHLVKFPPLKTDRLNKIQVNDPDYKLFMRDKGVRLLSGLLFSQQFNPDYIFPLDYDDWLNINIVDHLHRSTKSPVWYVEGGYTVNFKIKEYKRRHGMLRYCGSVFAFENNFLLELANINSKTLLDAYSTKEELISATSDQFVEDILGNHVFGYYHFSRLGLPPRPFPFRAMAWVTETGANVSKTPGGIDGIPINSNFCKLFGLPKPLINQTNVPIIPKIREAIACAISKISWLESRLKKRFIY
ncbi:hypothetical protein KO519_05605 [Paraglaciecola agarilytica]|uniref:hypothetical protein n=1 Tax=Paraglaciecola chathamensis TaxID=368405 RepID=UPI001C098D1A|nr:hypothetical protein [Paraglaciecola agarilytica]MBU3017173.1 hypothetical protein [Paraglaciecola agarilytica]